MTPFTISAKNLASLNMPNVDLCSFWYLLHLEFRRPWDMFPPIFNDFDRRQKRMVHLYIDRHGCAPKSLGEFADGISYLDVGAMRYWHQPTNIVVNAIPDDVFELKDGRLSVVDYKTARYTKGQDKLLPLYRAQLSAYCHILESLKKGKVAKAALIYFEPVTDDSDEELLKSITKGGFGQEWNTTPVKIEIEKKTVPELLDLARKVYDMNTPPECKGKCRTCDILKAIYQLYRSVMAVKASAAAQNQDGAYLRAFQKSQRKQLQVALSLFSAVADSDNSDFNLWDHWDWS